MIGRKGFRISEADALDHVAGYTIGLDMTIRGTEDRSFRKSLDTFTVLGPWVVTTDELGDPSELDFEIRVDGESRQKANTRDLILDCAQLIAYASRACTLWPGDVIMTGTPEGVAPVPPDQRHGRAFQRTDRRGAAIAPFSIRRGTGNHAAPLRPALQPAASPVSLGQQDALAGDEGMAQTQTRTVQETAISPSGM